MLGTVLSVVGFNVKRQVRHVVMTAVLALVGAILMALALGFGIALLYHWLKLELGTLEALAIMAGGWALLGIILLLVAFYRPRPGARRYRGVDPLREPAVAAVQMTEQAMDNATGIIRDGSRKQVFGALVIAALAGFLVGRRL